MKHDFPSLNHIVTPPPINLTDCWLPNGFYDSTNFIHAICRYDHLDVVTYSVSPHVTNLRRVIYVEGIPPRAALSCRVTATHMKLWLAYPKHSAIPDVFIGSANATAMTLHELMYKVSPSQAKALQEYFTELWANNHKAP